MHIFKNLSFIFTLALCACAGGGEESEVIPNEVRVSNVEVMENVSNSKVVIDFEKSGNAGGEVSITYSTFSGTASSGEDFVALSNRIIRFGESETRVSVEIEILDDSNVEGTENFKLILSNPVNTRLFSDQVNITIFDNDLAQVDFLPSSGYESPSSYPGYNLVWSDDFNQLDTDIWQAEIGTGCPNLCGWGNDELQYYTSDNAYVVDGGYLVIEAKSETIESSNYTSSRLISKGKKTYRYGRIDIRAALPRGQGLWPALWMLGENIDEVGWPRCGEIDIMELVGNEPDKVHGTIHWDNAGQYASTSGDVSLDSGEFIDEFHVFSIIWDENKIEWLLDNQVYKTVDTTPANLEEFHKPFFFIFNVAVGGRWPGNPNSSTVFPQRMIVDYIRVFQ